MSKRSIINLVGLALVQAAVAQQWRTVPKEELMAQLDASTARYETLRDYEVRHELLAYTNSTDEQASERQSSVIWKVGKSAKAEHLGMISYQDERLSVTVDPDDETMVIAEPMEFFAPLGPDYRHVVLDAAMTIGKADDASGSRYRVRLAPGGDFEILEFAFDAQGWLRRVESHWGHAFAVEPDNPLSLMITPKVVLELGVPKRMAPGAMRIGVDEAVLIGRDGPVAAKRYAGYTVIDNRLHP